MGVRRRTSCYGATRSCAELERNMPFYETNPPFLRTIFCVSSAPSDTYVVCRVGLQVGSFWKTNPPGGVLPQTTAASRPTRFGKRTHKRGPGSEFRGELSRR